MRSSSLFKDYSLLAKSGLFDVEYYRRDNPGLASHVDPLLHYLERGAMERRNPGPAFDTDHYIAQCRDLGEAPENPLLHYLTVGVAIGLEPLPMARGDPGGHLALDTPTTADGVARLPAGATRLIISGWALAAEGITGIEIAVDHAFAAVAYHGIKRMDVAEAFPDNPDSIRAGFEATIRCDGLGQGYHSVTVTGRCRRGNSVRSDFVLDVPSRPRAALPNPLRNKVSGAETALYRQILAGLRWSPRFLLILPIADGDNLFASARSTIASLETQIYRDWRLVIVRGPRGPAAATVRAKLLDGFDSVAKRAVVQAALPARLLGQLIGASSPQQAWLTSVISPGTVLGCDALIEIAIESAMQRDTEILYGDEQRVNPKTGAIETFLKPEWSPDLLESTNYIGRFWCARSSLFDRVGVTTTELFRHSAYDLVLRCTETAAAVGRVPRVLCESAAGSPDSAAKETKALVRALDRRGIRGEVRPGQVPETYEVRRQLMGTPSVSIVIATRGAGGHVKTCIETLRRHTAFRNFEIICVATASPKGDRLRRWLREHSDQMLTNSAPFDAADGANRAAALATGEFLLFLDDMVEITEPGWLEALVVEAQRPEIGAVGGILVGPDGSMQHAGMFLAGSTGRYAFREIATDAASYFGLAQLRRNVVAVTDACLLTRRETFLSVGGFETAPGPVDRGLDYCLRLRETGMLTIVTPRAKLIQRGDGHRGQLEQPDSKAAFEARWHTVLARGDPYFHPGFLRSSDGYVLDPEPIWTVCAGPVATPEEIRRILVIKLDHIGDCVIAIGPLRRLARHFPHARLTLLSAPTAVPIWEAVAEIAEVIPFQFFHPRSGSGLVDGSPADLERLSAELNMRRFDLAVDLRKHPETRHLLLQSGARWLAGFDYQGHFPWLDIALEWEGDVRGAAKRRHAKDDLVNLVDAIAASLEPSEVAPVAIGTTNGRKQQWRRLFRKPVVCVHPAAGSLLRQWPAEHFAALIDRLVEMGTVNVALVGTADERDIEQSILRRLHNPLGVFSLFGQLELVELPKFIARCALFVGNNSGPQHIAAALGIPTIGIHSGVVDAREWGPVGPAALAIGRSVSCAFCYLTRPEDCHRGIACLTELRPGDVFTACRRLLALRSL